MIVEQSNLYASICMGDSFSSWNPISIDEIYGIHDTYGFSEITKSQ